MLESKKKEKKLSKSVYSELSKQLKEETQANAMKNFLENKGKVNLSDATYLVEDFESCMNSYNKYFNR